MEIWNEKFLSVYDLLAKHLVTDQMTYLEQMYKRPLKYANIDY